MNPAKTFEDVRIGWNSNTYVVPADRVMGAIAAIEEVVTLKELAEYAQRQTMPMAKLSMAYGSLLRYAGANVRDEEVYRAMYGGDSGPIVSSIQTLLFLMVPVDLRQTVAKPGKHKGAASPSSRRTKQQSGTDGVARPSSGD